MAVSFILLPLFPCFPPSLPNILSLYDRARLSSRLVSGPSAPSYSPLVLRLPLPCSWHWVDQYNNKIDDNVTNVFGAKFLSSLVPFNLDLDADDDGSDEANVNERKGDDANATPSAPPVAMVDNNDPTKKSTVTEDTKPGERRIWGMVSKAGVGVGRADNDRQFLYLNGRPVDLPKVTNRIQRSGWGMQDPHFLVHGTWCA